jgi:phospho-N-acetylmuramoyl-pentapeptide-transferase
MSGHVLDFGIFNIPIMIFIAVATVNGTNFTDGVDGLCSCVTVAVTLFFVIAAAAAASGVILAGSAMIGALLGFLLYNAYPAKVFMGDTGSLAIGGFVTGMAYMLRLPLFIPIVGFIYFIEVVSVIIQVTWFRRTGGKRFFRMAPIHHHFELGGWSEVRVVAVFTIITAVLGAFAILLL